MNRVELHTKYVITVVDILQKTGLVCDWTNTANQT